MHRSGESKNRIVEQNLSPTFSTRALEWQEVMVKKYITLLIEQLKKHAQKDSINAMNWFEWLSFDIIGDLTFGESFDALVNGKTLPRVSWSDIWCSRARTVQPHHWISVIPDTTTFMLFKDMSRRVSLLKPLTSFVLFRRVMNNLIQHYQLITEKTKKLEILSISDQILSRSDSFIQTPSK